MIGIKPGDYYAPTGTIVVKFQYPDAEILFYQLSALFTTAFSDSFYTIHPHFFKLSDNYPASCKKSYC